MSHRLLCRIEQCTFRDKFRAMLRYLILVCLSADLQGFILAKESCLGGRSLRGLTELKPHHYYGINNITTSVSCCDENVCHGGLTLKNEQVSESSSFIINKPFGDYDLQHQYAQQLLLQSNDDASAEKTFMRVRHLDENNVETMDQYAQLFQRRGAVDELNRLAMEMLEINDKRPEAWVILALYHETRSDHEKALGTWYPCRQACSVPLHVINSNTSNLKHLRTKQYQWINDMR